MVYVLTDNAMSYSVPKLELLELVGLPEWGTRRLQIFDAWISNGIGQADSRRLLWLRLLVLHRRTRRVAAKTNLKAAWSCSFNISYATNVLIRRLADDAPLSLIRNCLQLTVLEADCKDKALSKLGQSPHRCDCRLIVVASLMAS